MEIMSGANTFEGFISYKIKEDVLAEVFANNGIRGVEFASNGFVTVTRCDDGLIFSREGTPTTLIVLMFNAWGGTADNVGMDSYMQLMQLPNEFEAKADCLTYKLSFEFSGSNDDKAKALAELFMNTDLPRRLENVETRTAGSAQGLYRLPFGDFGQERRGYKGGKLSYWRINCFGGAYSDDNAALLFKDGELTVSDRDGMTWTDAALTEAMMTLNEAAAPEGVTVLKKLDCREVRELTLMPVFLEVSEGAFSGCPNFAVLNVLKKNILLEKGCTGSNVKICGCKGSTAEKYAEDGGNEFAVIEYHEIKPREFEIASGVVIKADTFSVYRTKSDNRADLSDISYEPFSGAFNDFDIEIIDLSENEARESGMTAQLESFGQLTDTETVRNDRSGYIKATMMRSADHEDIFGYVLEIDRGDRVICLHTEQQFTAEELEKGADKALFERYKELGASVDLDRAPAPAMPEKPSFKFAEPEPVVEKTAAPEPVAEETVTPEPVVEETAAPELVTEETVAPEPVVEETAVPEPVVEETVAPEPVVEETAAPELVAEETAVPEPVAEETAAPEPIVEETAAPEPETAAEEIIDVEPEDIPPADEPEAVQLVRGARFDLGEYTDKMLVIEMDYQAEAGLDIDGYVFLLTAKGKVRSDADLVFFGQKASVDRAVNNHPTNTRCFTVELGKLDNDITKLAVAFAIYGDNAEQVFRCVTKPVVHIKCNGTELCSYELEGLAEEKSTVALELYNKNGWKVKTVGLGYKEALRSLCGNYGVEVK